jgi:hypothetical protein
MEGVATPALTPAQITRRHAASLATSQGLTLVDFSAQLECFLWDRGARGVSTARLKGVLGGVYGV